MLKGFGYNHRDYNQLEQPVVADTKRIMLIDHSLDIGFSFKIVLEEEYHDDSKLEVDIFTDPLVALDNFRIGLYDLVITAAVMSKINGFEVYNRLRELDDKVKVCFLVSGKIYQETAKGMFPELDEENCFIKIPITNQNLIEQVKDILKLNSNLPKSVIK